jgi:MoaA/NifB/PqqE/SkfB family radical SAM enzyme
VDFNERPFIAIWEATQACDLACVHCRASAQPLRSSFELSTAEAKRLIDQIAEMRVPVFVITGGDPLKRPDIFDLVEYATARGLRTSLTPSATPLLTREAIAELQRRGLARLAVSLDGQRRKFMTLSGASRARMSGRYAPSAGHANSPCPHRSTPPLHVAIWRILMTWCGCCKRSISPCGAYSFWSPPDAANWTT